MTEDVCVTDNDRSIMLSSMYIRGSSVRARMMRRNVARYMCLLQVKPLSPLLSLFMNFFQVLLFRTICAPVKKRFPTIKSLVDAGYILPEEEKELADTKFWLPIKQVNDNDDDIAMTCV